MFDGIGFLPNQHILWFHVPMYDSVGMKIVEGFHLYYSDRYSDE